MPLLCRVDLVVWLAAVRLTGGLWEGVWCTSNSWWPRQASAPQYSAASTILWARRAAEQWQQICGRCCALQACCLHPTAQSRMTQPPCVGFLLTNMVPLLLPLLAPLSVLLLLLLLLLCLFLAGG